ALPCSSELTWARPLGVLSGQDDDLRVVRDRRHGVTLADVNDPADPDDAFLVCDLCRNALREPLPRDETRRRTRRVLDVGLRHHAVGGVRRGSPRTVATSVGGRVGRARGGVQLVLQRSAKVVSELIEGVGLTLKRLGDVAPRRFSINRDFNVLGGKCYLTCLAVDALNSAPATTRPRC